MTTLLSAPSRIIISFEIPELEAYAREFCATCMPNVPVQSQSIAAFIEQSHLPHNPDELLIVVLSADSDGHLQTGAPIVSQLMSSVSPVLVLRRSPGQQSANPPINRVVVPLDGSSVAGQAVPIASQVARMNDIPVKFVMVIDPNRVIPPAYAYDPEAWGVIEELRTTAHWALSQAETMMRSDGVTASSDLLLGSINASLMASINEGDLVVMTTHGPGRQNMRYRDSVAQRVLESTLQPILIMQAAPQHSLVVNGHQDNTWTDSMKPRHARIA